MRVKRARVCADEVAWLAARLNRRASEMDGMDPDSTEFRHAVLMADYLLREITAALTRLRNTATQKSRPH